MQWTNRELIVHYVGSLFIDKVRVGEKFDVNIRFNLIKQVGSIVDINPTY